jgi:hypothetical protein
MIKELRREYPVRLLCRVLEVSRSGFHAWLVRKPSRRARWRERLKVAALAAHQRTRQTYGAERERWLEGERVEETAWRTRDGIELRRREESPADPAPEDDMESRIQARIEEHCTWLQPTPDLRKPRWYR